MAKFDDKNAEMEGAFSRARMLCESDDAHAEAGVAVEHLAEVIESHFMAEEAIYFPTISGLRPEFKQQLAGFVEAHQRIGGSLRDIARLLKRDDFEKTVEALDCLSKELGEYQSAEAKIFRKLEEIIYLN